MASRFRKISGRLLTAAALSLSAAAVAQQGPPAAPVAVAQAQLRAMAPVSWVAGTVASIDDANIAAEVPGRLVSVAEEGDRVARNAVLARLDDTLFKADVAEARAAAASEQANLSFLRREVERLQRLAEQNNAAQTLLEQTLSQRDASQNNLEAARARLQVAEERLERTQLRAPFAGVVVRRAKRVGEWVDSGAEVVQLVDTEHLEIETTAPVALRPYLRLGQTLAIRGNGQRGSATLRALVPVADAQSRLLQLRLAIDTGQWLAGQAVQVALPTALPQQALSVPRDALVLRRGGNYLFRVNGESMAEQVFVELGIADGDFIQVSGDLAAGEAVVVRGNERLRPGQPVRVLNGAAQ